MRLPFAVIFSVTNVVVETDCEIRDSDERKKNELIGKLDFAVDEKFINWFVN